MKKLNDRAWFCLRIVMYVITSIALAFGIYRWNARTLAGNLMPMPFGRGMAVVLSGSMEPELYKDDLVFVKAAKEYEIGDVVVYQSGNELIIHRIYSISSDGKTVVTMGDNNGNSPDDPIDISDIKGKMTGKITGVGGVITVLRSPVVVVLLLAAAVALLVLSGRSDKKKQDEATEAVKEEIRRLKEGIPKSTEEASGENDTTDDTQKS